MSEVAMFAAGCFWGIEAAFRKINGVLETEVGYAGGHVPHPTYMQVCSHNTGHAEVVRVTFDPERVSYDELLDVFWKIHTPTSLNRQGPDVGSQYRSAIFYFSSIQHEKAISSKENMEKKGIFSMPIVTEIVPASEFYRAEEYHQRYAEKHSG